jgi:hypothetical protein
MAKTAKTRKARKGPTPSATKYNIGTKKLGNDRYMWKIVANKNGTKRWARVTSVSKKGLRCPKKTAKVSKPKTAKVSKTKTHQQYVDEHNAIRAANKPLYAFWLDLVDQKRSVFIYKDKSHKIIKTNVVDEMKKAENDDAVVAILDSGPSFDAYIELYQKAKSKSVTEVIKNYKKYFNAGQIGKRLLC